MVFFFLFTLIRIHRGIHVLFRYNDLHIYVFFQKTLLSVIHCSLNVRVLFVNEECIYVKEA